MCAFPLSGPGRMHTLASFQARPIHFLSVDKGNVLYCACSNRVCARGPSKDPGGITIDLAHSSRRLPTHFDFAHNTHRTIPSPSNGRITFAMEKRIFIASIRCKAAGRVARAPRARRNLSFKTSGHALICTDRHKNG